MPFPGPPNVWTHSTTKYAAIPLPSDMVPTHPSDLQALSDEQILDMPPHVLVHLMRTAAQGGLQVISPRQIPSALIVKRTHDDSTATFLHVAGSDAAEGASWPVPTGHTSPDLEDLDGEPMAKYGEPLAHITSARVDPLVRIDESVASPIQKAWIKARANVDLQMCEDVNGDAEGLAEAYEALFKSTKGALMADPGVAVHPGRNLKDHALMVDSSLARQLAPIHVRRVVAVAAGPSSAAAFGPHRGFDWTCARVIAATKFYLTCQNENIGLIELARKAGMQVGDLLANPIARRGVCMVYHPTAAVAWSYDPESFTVTIDKGKIVTRSEMSKLVSSELLLGASFASPVAAAIVANATTSWVRTKTQQSGVSRLDVFESMPMLISSAVTAMSSVSRSSGQAIRGEIYNAIASAPSEVQHKMARAFAVLRDGLKVFGGAIRVSPRVVSTLATRLILLNSHINAHICSAAMVRGKDPELWFMQAMSMLPLEMRDGQSGSKGWAKAAVFLMLHPPDGSWSKLVGALNYRTRELTTPSGSHAGASQCMINGDHDSAIRSRIYAAVSFHKAAFCASYDGAALGCILCARMSEDAGFPNMAKLFRASAAGWTLRLKHLRAIRVTYGMDDGRAPKGSLTVKAPPDGPDVVAGRSAVARVTPSRAGSWWTSKVKLAGMLAPVSASDPGTGAEARVRATPSMSVPHLEVGIAAGKELAANPGASVRYGLSTSSLADAMARNLALIVEDASGAVDGYCSEYNATMNALLNPPTGGGLAFDLAMPPISVAADFENLVTTVVGEGGPAKNGWFWITQAEYTDSQYINAMIEEVEDMAMVMDMTYATLDDFLDEVDQADENRFASQGAATDVLQG